MADDRIEVAIAVSSDGAEQGSNQAAQAILRAVGSIEQQMKELVAQTRASSAAMAQGFSQMAAAAQASNTKIQTVVRNTVNVVDDFGNEIANVTRQVSSAATAQASAVGQVEAAGKKLGHTTTAARREMLVLAHELAMGNYKRFFGSLMVLGEQMDWMHALMSPLGASIGVIVGALGLAGLAALHGAEQMSELRNSLVLTGNYAGITAGQFMTMGDQIAQSTDRPITAVRTALAAVAGTGRFTGEALEPVAAAVAKIGQYSSASAEQVAKSFEGMSDGVYKWAVKYNESYHFATNAQLEHIRLLEEEGQVSRAQAEAADLVIAKINQTAVQLGYLPGAWNAIRNAAASAWDAMENWGRPLTIDDQIAKLKSRIDSDSFGEGTPMITDADRQRLRQLQQQRDQQQAAIAEQAKSAQVQNEGTKATQQLRSEWKGLGGDVHLADQEVKRFRDSLEAAKAAARDSGSAVPSDIQRMIDTAPQIEAAIRKRYDSKDFKKPTGQVTATNESSQAQARATAQLNLLKEQLREQQDTLDRAYKQQQVSLQSYYAQRLDITLRGMDAELSALRAQLAQTEALEARARSPQERLSLQTKQIDISGKLAVMEAQRGDAVRKSSQEAAQAMDQEARALQDLQAKRDVSQGSEANKRALLQAQQELQSRKITQAQLLQLEEQFAQQETALSVRALQERLDTERDLTVSQRQQIQDQISQIQDQGQTRALQLSVEAYNAQTQSARQAAESIEDGFSKSFASVVDGSKNARSAFTSFVTSIDQMLTQLVAKKLFQQLFDMDGSGGSPGTSVTGLLTSGLGKLLGSAGGSIFSAAGAFGFNTGLTGVAGSAGAVAAGAGASGGEGLSALLGLASFDVGTPFVPHDMVAQIHQGEAIVPAHLNSPYNPGNSTVTNNFILPNQIDTRTQSQIGSMAGASIQLAMQRNR